MTQSGHSIGQWRRMVRGALALLLVLRLGASLASYGMSGTFVNLQDRWLLLLGLALGGAAMLPWGRAPRLPRLPQWRAGWVWALTGALFVVCWAGHGTVLAGYDLSRDEQMATFDAWIYRHGAWAWPLPPGWQADANMLNLLFMLPVKAPVAWVSAYLPGNALLHAVLGTATGPLLTALSMPLLWGVARQLWPETREPAVIALMLFAGSGAVVLMGMTAYAMPAHLFANLLWLRLFLLNRRDADAGAMLVGALATGLHQPLFHPLFVAPWLLVLLVERRWARLGFFTLGYLVIGLAWLGWPHFQLALVAGPHSLVDPGTGYLARLGAMLAQNHQNLPMMAANLLRFFTWNHVLLLPLLLASARGLRADPRGLALMAGLVGPVLLFAVILPYQGHGFGYRYLHGLLGSAALLGAYGWQRLATEHAALRPLFWRASVLGLVVMLPVQMGFAHRLYAPFAAVSARIAASGADYVLIGADDGPFALDLVLNPPDVGRRPVRLAVGEIDDVDALAARLCPARALVALPADSLFDPLSAAFGVPRAGQADGRLAEQRQIFAGAGCRVMVLP